MGKNSDTTINEEDMVNQPLLLDSQVKPEPNLGGLTKIQVFGYSIGHLQNDLTVACWFNYTLYFIQNIIFAKSGSNAGKYAGLVLLYGQIADGLATPVIGYLSDKFPTRWGKRTPWYVFGFLLETISFVFIFQRCATCEEEGIFGWDKETSSLVYFVLFASLYNIGWAAVQVPHMALVPSLTLSRKIRDELNNKRNTFTYIANLFVLIFALGVFQFVKVGGEKQFFVIALVSTLLGVVSCIFFLVTVPEVKLIQNCQRLKRQLKGELSDDVESPSKARAKGASSPVRSEESAASQYEYYEDGEGAHLEKNRSASITKEGGDEEAVAWTHWFKQLPFYLYGFVYMGVRMLVNVQSSLIIFYLQNVLGMSRGKDLMENGLPIEFALIPMIIYICSTVTSNQLEAFYQKLGRKNTFSLGAVASLFGVAVRMFLNEDSRWIIYPLSIFIGLGQSICLNTGISLISEVVGSKGGSGAFVFGAYGLLDKIMNGVVLYYAVETKNLNLDENRDYVRVVSSLIPGLAVAVAWILVMRGKAADYDEGDIVLETPSKKNDKPKKDGVFSLQEEGVL